MYKTLYDTTAISSGTVATHFTGYLPKAEEIRMELSQLVMDTVVIDCADPRSAPALIFPADHGRLKTYSIPGGFIRSKGGDGQDPFSKNLQIASNFGTVRNVVLLTHGGCPEAAPCKATGELITESIIGGDLSSYSSSLFGNQTNQRIAAALKERNPKITSDGPTREDSFDVAAMSLFASSKNFMNWRWGKELVRDHVNSGELNIIPVYEEFDIASKTVKLHIFNQSHTDPAFVQMERTGSFVERLQNEGKSPRDRAGNIEGICNNAIREFTKRIKEGGRVITPGP